MFCSKCSAFNPDQAVVCFQCGQTLVRATPFQARGHVSLTPAYDPLNAHASDGGGKAIASLVLGIISLVAWCIPLFGLPTSIVGLVLGLKSNSPSNRGTALPGIILCVLGLILSVINSAIGAYQGATGQAWWQR